jgi:hypothetical protein
LSLTALKYFTSSSLDIDDSFGSSGISAVINLIEKKKTTQT